jgi:Icc-related predicted phosphoesterase
MIRVACIGDLHMGVDTRGKFRDAFACLDEVADVLLVSGDLTQLGTREEACVVADELSVVPIPCLAVLGNHDHEAGETGAMIAALEAAGVRVLEGDAEVVEVGNQTLGVAGTKGFGGGFAGACGSEFGEPEMKAFVQHTKQLASQLHDSLAELRTDARIALLHFAPTKDTLSGERLEIYPFLGSYLLGEAIDRAGADLVVHGHAHNGVEKGLTAGGIPVRNTALPVIQSMYALYCLRVGADDTDDGATRLTSSRA